MSMVSWFYRFRGVNDFIVSCLIESSYFSYAGFFCLNISFS